MRLTAFRVFVDDLAAARAFYQGVLGLRVAWESEDAAIGFDAGVDLIVESLGADADAADRALIGRFVGCSLAVDDIAATYAALTARGVTFIGPPERQPWGGVLAHFEDPSRNILTLLGR
jgi:catechol 2,3-dioxygenase-like lactoylglutathione lyase family enzyme